MNEDVMNPSAETGRNVLAITPRSLGSIHEMIADQSSGRVQFGRMSVSESDSRSAVDWSIGYRRWEEFDPTNGIGQDAAAVRGDSHYIAGVVVDGVSQSFYGDIAATQLSNYLLDLLWSRRNVPPLTEELGHLLKALEEKVDREFVKTRKISLGLDDIVKEALETTRASGSQAVFSSFILDVSARQLVLYQVGDVDAVVYRERDRPQIVAANASGRWSSAGKSKLSLERKIFNSIRGIVLRSDGIGREWGLCLDDDSLDEGSFASIAARFAVKDDVSFVAVRIRPAVQLQVDDRTRPGLTRLESRASAAKEAMLPLVPAIGSARSFVAPLQEPRQDYQLPFAVLLLSIGLGLLIGFVFGYIWGWQAASLSELSGPPRYWIESKELGKEKRGFLAHVGDFFTGGSESALIHVVWSQGVRCTLKLDSPGFSARLKPADALVSIPVQRRGGTTQLFWHLAALDGAEFKQGTLNLRAEYSYELAIRQ